MTDFAALQMKIDSTQVKSGVQELDKLTAAGGKAETATKGVEREWVKASSAAGRLRMEETSAAMAADRLSKSTNGAGVAAAKMARDAQGAAAAATRMAGAFKVGAHHTQNLAFQVQDVVQGLLTGQPPLQIFLQQGGQIAGIMGQAGIGVGGLAKALGQMAARWAPVIAGAAAAGAAMYAWTQSVNAERKAELDAYTASLGLTKEQIDEVGGAAVTAGDLMGGLWDVIKEAVGLEDIFADLNKWIIDTFRSAAQDAKKNIAEIYAAVASAVDGIKHVWNNIGPIMGEAVIAGANIAIAAVEKLINSNIDGINMLVKAANPLLALADMAGLPVGIPHINLERMKNQYAGAGKAAAQAFSGSYEKHRLAAEGWMQSKIDAVEDAAVKRRNARLAGAMEDGGKKAGGKAGKAAGDAFNDEFAKAMDRLESAVDKAFIRIAQDARKAVETAMNAGAGDLDDIVGEINKRRQWEWDEARRVAEEDRNRALDTAYEIADIIGGRIGQAIGDIANALDRAFPGFVEKIGKAIGVDGAALGKQLGAGAQIGAGIDGVFGAVGIKSSKAGAQIGGMIGSFAGPLGTIAGSILGGIVGGMLKSTPRASATVSIIAGEAMETAIKGSSGKLKAIAGEMASGLIAGLEGIAAALGAELAGNASVSVGVRKGNYRVDPTGQGITKTSKGAIDFGDDKAAANAYALQVALRQLDFTGVSDSIKRLIQGTGDLQVQLDKALAFKSVADDLLAMTDPQGSDLAGLEKWRAGMDKIFAEASATADELAQLEELTGLKRLEIARKYAEQQRGELELRAQIYAMEGDRETADAITRHLRLQGLSETERALTLRLMQLEAEEALALRNAAIADERYALETQLYQVLGDMAKLQERQLATLSEANRPLQQHIWILEQQKAAAEEAARAAEEAAQLAKSIADERLALETRLLQLNGDTAALRERELAALDPSNRALLALIHSREDEIAAAQEVARAAEEAAARLKAIADEAYALETQWLQAIGDTVSLRQRELELLDPSNRALRQQIWAYEDQAAAQADAARQAEEMTRAVSEMASRFTGYAQAIREFQAGLFGDKAGGSHAGALAEFKRVSSMAALGDEASLQSFVGVSQKFLDSARSNAGSSVDYRRALGMVSAASGAAAGGADKMAQMAMAQVVAVQISAAEAQVQSQASLESLAELKAHTKTETTEVVPTLINVVGQLKTNGKEAADAAGNRERAEVAMAGRLSNIEDLLARVIRNNKLYIASEDTLAVNVGNTVTVTGSVTVANDVGSPVPVDQI